MMIYTLILLSIATLLLTPSSYNFLPVLLTMITLIYLIKGKVRKTDSSNFNACDMLAVSEYQYQTRWLRNISLSLVIYFFVFVIYRIVMNGQNSEMDNPSRALLFLPLLWLPFRLNLSKVLNTIFVGSAIGAMIAAIVSSYGKWILHAERAFPQKYMYIQAGDMSMSLALFSLLGVFVGVQRKHYNLIGVTLIGFLSGVFASVISGSRGGWIILIPVLIWFIFLYREIIGKKLIAILSALFAVIVLAFVVIPQTGIVARYQDTIHNINLYEKNNSNTSIGLRFEMWKSALIAIRERPLSGWGAKGIQKKKEELIRQHMVSPKIRQFTHVHNQYLNDWAERGILGLASVLSILIIPFVVCVRYMRKVAKGSSQYVMSVLGAIHILAVASYGLSQGFLEHNSGNMFYFFILSLFMGILLHSRENE